jgi:DNA-binding MarR family transcriptional regulator
MPSQSSQGSDFRRNHEFVQHLLEAMRRITNPLPEALSQLLNELDELPPQEKPRNIANPIAFIRMSNMLYRNTSPTMGELSQALAVSLPTATRMVEWFVGNGYAQRLPDSGDRRIVRVGQTDKGRRLHGAIADHVAQIVQSIVGCLTEDEQMTLLTLLRKMALASTEDAGHGFQPA